MKHCFLKVGNLHVVVRIRWILNRVREAGPGVVEEGERAASGRSNSFSDVRVEEASSKFPGVDDNVETMNRPFKRIVDLVLIDLRGVLGQSMALDLNETSVLSTTKGGGFFLNLAELCPTGNRLRLPESRARLRG